MRSLLSHLSFRSLVCMSVMSAMIYRVGQSTFAQTYDGQGISAGLADGGGDAPLREFILNLLFTVLSYVALVAVIMIVIAGIYFLFSGLNDNLRDTARKIILYTIVGVIIILISSTIVFFFVNIFDPAVATDGAVRGVIQ